MDADTTTTEITDLEQRLTALRATIAEYDARCGHGYGTRVYAADLIRLERRLAQAQAAAEAR